MWPSSGAYEFDPELGASVAGVPSHLAATHHQQQQQQQQHSQQRHRTDCAECCAGTSIPVALMATFLTPFRGRALLWACMLVLLVLGAMPAAVLAWGCLGLIAIAAAAAAAAQHSNGGTPRSREAGMLLLPPSHTQQRMLHLALLDRAAPAAPHHSWWPAADSLLFGTTGGRSSSGRPLTHADLAQLSTHVHDANCRHCVLGAPAHSCSKADKRAAHSEFSHAMQHHGGAAVSAAGAVAVAATASECRVRQATLMPLPASDTPFVTAAAALNAGGGAAVTGPAAGSSAAPTCDGNAAGVAAAAAFDAGWLPPQPAAAAAAAAASGLPAARPAVAAAAVTSPAAAWGPAPTTLPAGLQWAHTAFEQSLLAAFDSLAEDLNDDSCSICAICLGPFRAGALVTMLPCGHSFHQSCCMPWLLQQGRQSTCPLCKAAVFS